MAWQRWTREEDQVLRQLYPTMTAQEMTEHLPGRSVPSIKFRVTKLALSKRTYDTYWREPEGIAELRRLKRRLHTVAAVAEEIGFSDSTLRRWAADNEQIRQALKISHTRGRKRKKERKCEKCVWKVPLGKGKALCSVCMKDD